MIDLELLQELVAFKKYGTLSATAEHLLLSQPTVTRGMRKLEQELNVSLFNRQYTNRIALNDTGQLAAEKAEKLLQAENNFVTQVQNYDQQKHEIVIESIAPGPVRFLRHLNKAAKEKLTISVKTIQNNEVVPYLRNFRDRLIFTDQDIETDDIESMYLGIEYVGVGIDKFNPLSQKESITFKDLAGMKFLVVHDIGPWRKIIERNIPDAQFLYQEDLHSMGALSRYSNFPFFYSNLTQKTAATADRFDNDNRNMVQIDDPHNKLEIYGSYLKKDRKIIQPLLKKIIKNWPN